MHEMTVVLKRLDGTICHGLRTRSKAKAPMFSTPKPIATGCRIVLDALLAIHVHRQLGWDDTEIQFLYIYMNKEL
jgi:hypothetical protein